MGWLDWLIKLPCPLCEKSSRGGQGCFCRDCTQQLRYYRLDPWCVQTDPGQLRVYAWGRHQGTLRRALQSLKYQNQPRIGSTLGEWIGQAWRQTEKHQPRYTVIPIPLHEDRLKERGYNQAELISQAFCDATGFQHLPHGLQRIRATQRQYGLGAEDRQQNLKNAFQVRQRPKHPVLIVDDIYTTGSTIATACAAFQQYKIPVAGTVVVARAFKDDESGHSPAKPILRSNQ